MDLDVHRLSLKGNTSNGSNPRPPGRKQVEGRAFTAHPFASFDCKPRAYNIYTKNKYSKLLGEKIWSALISGLYVSATISLLVIYKISGSSITCSLMLFSCVYDILSTHIPLPSRNGKEEYRQAELCGNMLL